MGRPIMIILSIVFGMALLSIVYVAFAQPIKNMGSTIMAKSSDILQNVKIKGNRPNQSINNNGDNRSNNSNNNNRNNGNGGHNRNGNDNSNGNKYKPIIIQYKNLSIKGSNNIIKKITIQPHKQTHNYNPNDPYEFNIADDNGTDYEGNDQNARININGKDYEFKRVEDMNYPDSFSTYHTDTVTIDVQDIQEKSAINVLYKDKKTHDKVGQTQIATGQANSNFDIKSYEQPSKIPNGYAYDSADSNNPTKFPNGGQSRDAVIYITKQLQPITVKYYDEKGTNFKTDTLTPQKDGAVDVEEGKTWVRFPMQYEEYQSHAEGNKCTINGRQYIYEYGNLPYTDTFTTSPQQFEIHFKQYIPQFGSITLLYTTDEPGAPVNHIMKEVKVYPTKQQEEKDDNSFDPKVDNDKYEKAPYVPDHYSLDKEDSFYGSGTQRIKFPKDNLDNFTTFVYLQKQPYPSLSYYYYRNGTLMGNDWIDINSYDDYGKNLKDVVPLKEIQERAANLLNSELSSYEAPVNPSDIKVSSNYYTAKITKSGAYIDVNAIDNV